ncbi:hypothetical protein [Sulfolobus acidocaldarius]|uniref:Conserved membrane protein n=4 Tax=Sulfolobus acidocaldarius TaxID=2285 RepID=Q4JBJ6_SULAC|nr:hypothetical protein [Sulfolobus acidocaldarius]AAY79833.1 conserved membrane protein [Sulfolobus acidocaldarius DSM 639]AGE70393.1 hypothetical protein SacN8_02060 [Sulfolobus acidocaldarius N8]AGE72667.1 hypothetical protein SacRon12I_02055 [Sulfolobus acidocaldarius Ron12/I]ALU29215.1 hypothetical protein ATY89_04200 [Sulfolobus acidocaldarius]ALU31942.1 hypothetical protein ATZ20_07225 [Sulfolobus acidocaldarius]
MEKKKVEEKKIRPIYVGLFNFGTRIVSAPISFVFTYLVAHYLSNLQNGQIIFATWQSMFVLIMGYFTLPADIFSLVTSRFSVENRPVGGILLLNLITGAISSLIYVVLTPYLMSTIGYFNTYAFYSGIIVILTFYVLRITTAITRGLSPRMIGISGVIFQISRLVIVLVLFYVFKLNILAVSLAYGIGYLAQTLVYSNFIKSNLKVDFKTTVEIAKKSLTTIISFLQLILEATIVWITLAITNDAITVAYFESAIIISNIVTWTYSLYDGLIAKLSETKSAEVVENFVKLYFVVSAFFLSLVIIEGRGLLYHLRPEYMQAFITFIIISISSFLRGLNTLFYQAVVMIDRALGSEERFDIKKSYTAKLNASNTIFAIIGVGISVILVYIYKGSSPALLSSLMTIGVTVNSVWMTISSARICKSLYSMKIPVKDIVTSTFISIFTTLVGIMFFSSNFSYLYMLVSALIGSSIFISLSYVSSPFARYIIKRGLVEIRKILMQ